MSVYLAEFIGTALLTLIGCALNAGDALSKTHSRGSGWIIISLGWGLAVTFSIYAVGDVSGAHINPAVTLGLAFSGAFDPSMIAGYVCAQVLGGAVGATLVWLHYLPHWKATKDPATKLGVFSTFPAIPSRFANLLSEIFGTFLLLFVLSYLGPAKFATGLNPLVVGLLVVIVGMAFGGTTCYAINPARDLGPRIAHYLLPIAGKGDSNWHYSWIPVLGPMIGGVLGATAYEAIFNQQLTIGLYLSVVITLVVIVMAIKEQK